MANPRSLAAARLLLRAAKTPCYPSSPSPPFPPPSARSASSWLHNHHCPNRHHPHPSPHTQSQRDHTSLSHGCPHAQPQHGHHRPAASDVACSSGSISGSSRSSSSSTSSSSSSSSSSSQQAQGVLPLVDSRAGPSSRAPSLAQIPLPPSFRPRHSNSPASAHAFAPPPPPPPLLSAFSHARSCHPPPSGIGCLGPIPSLLLSSTSHGGRGWSFSCGVAAEHSHWHSHSQWQQRQQQQRSVTYMPRPGDGKPRAVTLLPGDGVGPLVTGAVVQVMEAMHAPVYFETFDVSGRMSSVPQEVLDSLRKNKVGLKGGLLTPVGGGVSSLNVQLRKELDLFAHLVFAHNMEGLPTRHDGVNIVVIRENTEGEYSGLEHEVVPGVVESLKVITKFCSERIAQYAFEYAYLNSRRHVTAVHKANIMKLADGLFLESCRSVAQRYPSIRYSEVIVDNCCMQLVARPQQFDVMVTPNLYGTLVANAAAGICGGSTIMPGGNVGEDVALFEQGASAGNVGTPKQVATRTANPTALLLSAAMMLRHLQFPTFADNLEVAVRRVVRERRCLTPDIGGSATTQHMVDAVIGYLV